jgi:RNA polymerase sigma factor (sigma-70 family)
MREFDADNELHPALSEKPEAAHPARPPLTATEAAYAKELFEIHRLSLYRYLKGLLRSRDDANEVLQETYLRLLRQPGFEHVQRNVRAYLFQIATNLVRDHFRQRQRSAPSRGSHHTFAPEAETPDLANGPDLALQAEQLRQIVVAALATLDSEVRLALLLHRFRDLTHREIATFLQVSERTVERYIKEGLAHIAARLEKHA